MHRPVVLLLTATIAPRGVAVRRADPAQRMADYRGALQRFAATPGVDQMVLAENSGSDLAPLRAVAPEAVMVGFDDPTPAERGKGYGEIRLIARALAETRLADEALVLKATGRTAVANLPAIVAAMRAQPEVDLFVNLNRHLTTAESRLFAMGAGVIRRHLLPLEAHVDDSAGRYMEHAVAQATLRAIADGHAWRSLPQLPRFVGVSGTSGARLQAGRLKFARKALYHRLRSSLLGKRIDF